MIISFIKRYNIAPVSASFSSSRFLRCWFVWPMSSRALERWSKTGIRTACCFFTTVSSERASRKNILNWSESMLKSSREAADIDLNCPLVSGMCLYHPSWADQVMTDLSRQGLRLTEAVHFDSRKYRKNPCPCGVNYPFLVVQGIIHG